MRRLGFLVLFAVCVAPASAHIPVERDSDVARGWASFNAARAQAIPSQQPEPPIVPTPRADCGPGSKPEPGMQGRMPREEVDSGRAAEGYWCNLTVIGRNGSTGGFRVHRYIDQQGHECAYYDTALLFPTNALSLAGEPTGVAVLDMTDPAKPVQTEWDPLESTCRHASLSIL